MNAGYIHFLSVSALVFTCAAASAQDAPLPLLKEGDKWSYSVKTESPQSGSTTRKWDNAIMRVSSTSMVLARKPADSNLPAQESMIAADWSRSTSLNGKLTTTYKLFDFPMQPGKTWTTTNSEDNPSEKLKLVRRTFNYKVIGWEEVKVPAGTFRALKIESDGDWYHEFQPSNAVAGSRVESGPAGSHIAVQTRNAAQQGPITGKHYKAIWYVPEVKREVKLVEESFSTTGAMGQRTTLELDSYQVAP